VIRAFAAEVLSIENLRMLTLHTLADSLGTSEQLWNGFKDSLLTQLYHRTHDHMSGAGTVRRVEERRRERLWEQVQKLAPAELEDDELQSHFTLMPARYFDTHEAEDIVKDLQLVHRFLVRQILLDEEPLDPVVAWEDEPDRGYTQLKVCTWDRPGLFSKIAASLTAAGLNILGAQIFSRADNLIVDGFTIVEARTGQLAGKEARESCERLLSRVLVRDKVNLDEQIARLSSLPTLYQSIEGERLTPQVQFDNDTSRAYTVLDLESEDHVGLLYAVTSELARQCIDVALARISTERGAAVDSFYITDSQGRKIRAPHRLEEIRRSLLERIASLARTGPQDPKSQI